MNVFLVAGVRPNFMKIAPIYRASLALPNVQCQIVHTGQHYDYAMSASFFHDLDIPEPCFHLEAGSGSHAVQSQDHGRLRGDLPSGEARPDSSAWGTRTPPWHAAS